MHNELLIDILGKWTSKFAITDDSTLSAVLNILHFHSLSVYESLRNDTQFNTDSNFYRESVVPRIKIYKMFCCFI